MKTNGVFTLMIEVVVNGRFLAQKLTGVQRYAHELMRALDRLFDEGKIDPARYFIQIAVPPNTQNTPAYKWIKVIRVGNLINNLWEQITLPLFARNKILFSPCNITPVLGGTRQIITIHDASVFGYPQTYTAMFLLKYKIVLRIVSKLAKVILTDSEFSKNELIRYCKIPAAKIDVVPLGHEHILNVQVDHNVLVVNNLIKRPYLLAVGSRSAHKNIDGLLLAVDQLKDKNFDLVVAGGVYATVFNNIEFGIHQNHIVLGYVNDQELRALYENALCFIYPSWYEGFGLPPLEAMACGCPVIVSDIPALKEVCADAALYCSPEDPRDIAEKIQQILDHPVLLEKMKHQGTVQASKFRWENTATAIWDKITSCVEK